MKKRFLALALALVCGMGFGVSAKEATLSEKVWDNFLETAQLQYVQGEGQVNLDLLGSVLADKTYDLTYGTEVQYGINDRVNLNTYLFGSSWLSSDLANLENLYYAEYGGEIQTKLYDHKALGITTKVGMSGTRVNVFNLQNDLTSHGGLYVDTTVTKNFVLHNNLKITMHEDEITSQMINGFDYQINNNQHVKGYLASSTKDFDLKNISHSLNLVYQNRLTNQIMYTGIIQKNLADPNMLYSSILELKPAKDVTVTGFYDYNTTYNDWIGVELQKELSKVILKANYALTVSDHYNANNIEANIQYKLSPKLDLITGLTMQTEQSDLEAVKRTTSLRTGIEYNL